MSSANAIISNYSTLKENQLRYYINEPKNSILKSIKFYCANNREKNISLNDYTVKQRFKSRSRKFENINLLPYGKSIYNYKDVSFEIINKEVGEVVATEGWSGHHECMAITMLENNKSYDENHTIFEDFFIEAAKYYSEKWMDQEDENKKVTVYVWDDDFWETLEKSLSRCLSTIYLDGKEQEIYNKLKEFTSEETEELYRKFGIPYKYNILFHGVPGTGKTSLIFALASELKMNIAVLSFTNDMNDTKLMKCFRRLPENCIIVIEDIDSLFESRKKNDDLKNSITFSGLLNITDGIAHLDKQIIIMTTNHPLVLDSALKRPGRIDLTMEFNYCNKNQIKQMFEVFLPNQLDNFDAFYNKVKRLNITTAMLQHFLFGNRLNENILDHVDELIKLCNQNNYESNKALYS